MSWFSIAVSVILPLLAAALFADKRRRKLRIARERSPVDPVEIFKSNYSDRMDQATFLKVWTDVSQCLNISPLHLRPTDRFGVDVGVAPVTTDELDTLADRAANHARERGVAIDLQSIQTVNDYIEVIGGLIMNSATK